MASSRKAVALKYSATAHSAPKVVAKGSGTIADAIIAKAEAFDVPLFQNKELVESLVSLDLDREIPAELYQAVAEVFVWLMKTEQRL